MQKSPVTIGQTEKPTSLLNKRELAACVKRSTRWVELRVEDGTIPAIKLGRTILFSWPDVLAALNRFRVNQSYEFTKPKNPPAGTRENR